MFRVFVLKSRRGRMTGYAEVIPVNSTAPLRPTRPQVGSQHGAQAVGLDDICRSRTRPILNRRRRVGLASLPLDQAQTRIEMPNTSGPEAQIRSTSNLLTFGRD
jgi:hypothetical protein